MNIDPEVKEVPAPDLAEVDLAGALTGEAQPVYELRLSTEEDAEWLAGYGVKPDPEWLEQANKLLSSGSQRLYDHYGAEDYSDIVGSRQKFFEAIGLGESVRKFGEISPKLIPLDTFVDSQRIMVDSGLDAAKIVNTFPRAIGLASESITSKLENMQELGLDAAKIVNTFPRAIGLASESITSKLENMQELGLDAVKIANTFPAAIVYAPEGLRAKLENMQELGLDAVKIVNAHPAAIGLASESITAKLENMQELGLDAVKIANTFPAAISLAPKSITSKLDNMQELGLDAAKIANTFPAAIGLAPENIRIKLYALMRYGLVDESRPFDSDNKHLIQQLFILPNESLILYLDSVEDHENLAIEDVPYQARKYMWGQKLGNSSKERKQAYEARLPKLAKSAGYIATMNALRLKVDKETIMSGLANED